MLFGILSTALLIRKTTRQLFTKTNPMTKNKILQRLGMGVAALAIATLALTSSFAQTLTLSGTSYTQNFNNIENGLPDGWTVRTGASSSLAGTITSWQTANSAPQSNSWSATTGRFANHAATVSNFGTNFVSNESAVTQAAATNRSLAIRQTGGFGDPGAAFVLRIENTIGLGNFEMAIDLLMLSVQTRSTVWTIDYAIGNTPSSFTSLGTYSDPVEFGVTTRNISFGSALNNQTENVWIRIAALGGSTGAGSRDTFGIDNLSLSWTSVGTQPEPPQITSEPQSRTNTAGTTATFSVGVSGSAPFTFQWKKGTEDLFDGPSATGSTISGATTATLSISAVRLADAGNYSVTIVNAEGSTNSQNAVLTVVQPAPIVTNIAYLRAQMDPTDFLPSDTTNLYSVEGIVTTPVNLTTPENAQFYMQDSSGGIAVFVSGGASIRPAQGDLVRVIGPLGHFNGLFELNLSSANFTHEVQILSSGNPLPQPAVFNFATLANPTIMEASVEGSYLVISNVFLQNAGGTFGGGVNYRMTNVNGLTAELRIDTRAVDVIGQTVPEFASSIKGVMGQFDGSAPYNSGYQFFLTLYSDIVPGTPPPVGPNAEPLQIAVNGQDVVLSWTSPLFNLQASSDVTGTYTNIPGATSPYTYPISGGQKFFRLQYP